MRYIKNAAQGLNDDSIYPVSEALKETHFYVMDGIVYEEKSRNKFKFLKDKWIFADANPIDDIEAACETLKELDDMPKPLFLVSPEVYKELDARFKLIEYREKYVPDDVKFYAVFASPKNLRAKIVLWLLRKHANVIEP